MYVMLLYHNYKMVNVRANKDDTFQRLNGDVYLASKTIRKHIFRVTKALRCLPVIRSSSFFIFAFNSPTEDVSVMIKPTGFSKPASAFRTTCDTYYFFFLPSP